MFPITFLSLGSNLGEREKMLSQARTALSQTKGIEIKALSQVIDNPALLYDKQPDFLNQVAKIESALKPLELLEKLKNIEIQLGRKKRFRYGPREIDLDILSYANFRCQEEKLVLPHPALLSRPYLKKLLEELGVSAEELFTKAKLTL